MRKSLRSALGLFVALALVGFSATAAFADSPSFHFANASVSGTTGALSVSFKETGLGTTVTTASIQLNADASADYQCWNNGGNHPKAGNKETVSGPLVTSGNFPVRNGQVTGTLTAGPLGPGSFGCPNGQNLFLMAVSYSNITVTDVSEGDGPFAASPSSISLSGLFIAV
jgi:hypothetical protein